MPVTFISAIDTGAGKTIVTGLLARYLQSQGEQVISAKISQTGNKLYSEDIEMHRKIMGMPLQDCDIEGRSCPYIFTFPASPHLAARLDGKHVDPDKIKTSINSLSSSYRHVLLEGVGGVMVPLTEKYTTYDFLKEQRYPVILVTTPQLGSINHTLLSIYALQSAGITIQGLIYNHTMQERPEITKDSINLFKNRFPGIPMVEVPHIDLEHIPDIDFSPVLSF